MVCIPVDDTRIISWEVPLWEAKGDSDVDAEPSWPRELVEHLSAF